MCIHVINARIYTISFIHLYMTVLIAQRQLCLWADLLAFIHTFPF